MDARGEPIGQTSTAGKEPAPTLVMAPPASGLGFDAMLAAAQAQGPSFTSYTATGISAAGLQLLPDSLATHFETARQELIPARSERLRVRQEQLLVQLSS